MRIFISVVWVKNEKCHATFIKWETVSCLPCQMKKDQHLMRSKSEKCKYNYLILSPVLVSCFKSNKYSPRKEIVNISTQVAPCSVWRITIALSHILTVHQENYATVLKFTAQGLNRFFNRFSISNRSDLDGLTVTEFADNQHTNYFKLWKFFTDMFNGTISRKKFPLSFLNFGND